jgi:hypothetical protein
MEFQVIHGAVIMMILGKFIIQGDYSQTYRLCSDHFSYINVILLSRKNDSSYLNLVFAPEHITHYFGCH